MNIIVRIAYGVAVLVAAFLLPWWVSLVVSLIGLVYIPRAYEVIFVGIIIDSLYGPTGMFGFAFPFTVILTVAFFIMIRLRKNLLL